MSEPDELLFNTTVLPPGVVAAIHKHAPKDSWPLHVAISDAFLGVADPEYVLSGDGMVRFMMSDGGTALYGLVHDDAIPDAHHYDLLSVSIQNTSTKKEVEQ